MKKLRVCVVTGTRAEFGIWQMPLRAILQSRRLELQLIVTGMHLLKDFGYTVRDIERSGIPIAARVAMYRPGEPPTKSLARGIEGLAAAYQKIKPDIVLLLGDRLEMLAAASAALAGRIPIGHLHGGESAPGIWDEQIRHAITKMAHLHLCATKLAAKRILHMGEPPKTVHVVGAPALDAAAAAFKAWRPVIPKLRLAAGTSPFLLLHPSSADDHAEYQRSMAVIAALRRAFDDPPVVHALGPNNDPGHEGILRAYQESGDRIYLRMSLPQEKFWLSLISSGLLIGNSSAGIIEAATFGIPVINLGDRQAGRERNANVIDVPWSAGAPGIEKAIRFAISNKTFLHNVAQRKNLYGDGHASERIVSVLEKLARAGITPEKRFHSQ